MPNIKKKPERMCVVCRQMHPKNELIRLVLVNGQVLIDETQKMQGRGVWLDKNRDCIINAEKRKTLNRAFKKDVDSQIYKKLESMING